MHYIDEGAGPVVLLLHGNPTWSFYYRNLIKELSRDHRVIAPDFIGLGLSDHPADAHFRAADRIEHLQELITNLNLDKFSLVMHDWGGSIGTGLAVRNPEKIERIVYLNTTLTVTESLPFLIKSSAAPYIGKFLTYYTKQFLKFTTEMGVVKKLDREVKKGYFLPYKNRKRRTAIWDFVADIPFDSKHPSYESMLDLATQIPKLAEKPVQIIWGMQDPCFHRDMLNHVAAHFPQARVMEIAEASHLVLEDATELVCATIRKFLTMPKAEACQPDFPTIANEEMPEEANELYHSFVRSAQNLPYTFAVILPTYLIDSVKYSQINFNDLRALINKYQRGLEMLGLKNTDKVLMLVSPGIDFLALSYAVMGRGATPVFLDPGMGLDKLLECIKNLKPDVFIGSPTAHILKALKGKFFGTIKFQIVAGDWSFGKSYSLSFLKKFSSLPLPAVRNAGAALIAYTSGATGAPKGVVFTNQMLKEQLRIFSEGFSIGNGRKDIPLLPIFSLYNLALGGCSIFPPLNPAKPLDLDPQKIVQIINELGIESSFGSPTLWKKIGEYCFRSKVKLISLKKVFMAGAPVPENTASLIKSLMLDGEVYTPYGATEALPVTCVSSSEIQRQAKEPAITGEQGTFVGKAISGVQIKVVEPLGETAGNISDLKELSAYKIGEIIIKGANVSPAYLNLPEADQKSKVKDAESFWHCIGDMGYLDRNGNLYFCGRKAHVVKTAERTFYSIPVESIYNAHPKVARSALVKLKDGNVAIVIEPWPQHWPETEAKQASFRAELKQIAEGSELTKGISQIFFHNSFPVDGRHNAKIYRDQLGSWASKQNGNLNLAA